VPQYRHQNGINFPNIFLKGGYNSSDGYVTVEPRLMHASTEVCMGRPKIVYRSKGLYTVGGKILYGWEKLYYSRTFYKPMIIIGFQPII